MIPSAPTDQTQLNTPDDSPRFFLDDTYDANLDSDWWLDLGRVDLPTVPSV